MSQIKAAYQYIFDSGSNTWIPAETVTPGGGAAVTIVGDDGIPVPVTVPNATTGIENSQGLQTVSFNHSYNGAAWTVNPSATPTTIASGIVQNPPIVIPPGNWSLTAVAEESTPPSVSRDATADVTHVVTAISARVMDPGGTTDSVYQVVLSSAGTPLAQFTLMLKADGADQTGVPKDSIELSGLNISGALGEDVTLAIDTGDTGVQQSVVMSGYSIGAVVPIVGLNVEIGYEDNVNLYGYINNIPGLDNAGTINSGTQPSPYTFVRWTQSQNIPTLGCDFALSGVTTPPEDAITSFSIYDPNSEELLLGPILLAARDSSSTSGNIRTWHYDTTPNIGNDLPSDFLITFA